MRALTDGMAVRPQRVGATGDSQGDADVDGECGGAGGEARLHVCAGEVGVGHEGAGEDLRAEVGADVGALAQVKHLV